jgi:hypothetical protein
MIQLHDCRKKKKGLNNDTPELRSNNILSKVEKMLLHRLLKLPSSGSNKLGLLGVHSIIIDIQL